MTKKDTQIVENAIYGALKHGVSDTYELKNGIQFCASFYTPNTFKITIFWGEYDEVITFNSAKAFLKFIS